MFLLSTHLQDKENDWEVIICSSTLSIQHLIQKNKVISVKTVIKAIADVETKKEKQTSYFFS